MRISKRTNGQQHKRLTSGVYEGAARHFSKEIRLSNLTGGQSSWKAFPVRPDMGELVTPSSPCPAGYLPLQEGIKKQYIQAKIPKHISMKCSEWFQGLKESLKNRSTVLKVSTKELWWVAASYITRAEATSQKICTGKKRLPQPQNKQH